MWRSYHFVKTHFNRCTLPTVRSTHLHVELFVIYTLHTSISCYRSDAGLKYSVSEFQIVAGFADLNKWDRSTLALSKTIVHPDYAFPAHDIGVLEVNAVGIFTLYVADDASVSKSFCTKFHNVIASPKETRFVFGKYKIYPE